MYMDDIIIFSIDVEEHIHPLDEILTTLGESDVTLNLKKCRIFSDSVECLGQIIKHGLTSKDIIVHVC